MRPLRSKAFPRFTVKSASGQQRQRRTRRTTAARPGRPDSGHKFKPMVPVATCYEPTFSPNGCYGIFGQDRADHSALILADRITLAHFATSSAMSFPNSAGVIGIGAPPSSARRDLSLGSARPALISRFSVAMISGGVFLGALMLNHTLTS